jgi:hypothetical protein
MHPFVMMHLGLERSALSNPDGGQSARTYRYAVILPHPTQDLVLLTPCAGGWSLPAWESGHLGNWEATGPINDLVRTGLGTSARALRAVLLDDDPACNLSIIYELERCASGWTPPFAHRWADQNELSQLALTHTGDRAALSAWFAGAGTERPTPWYNAGWQAVADAWFIQQAQAAGFAPYGPVAPVRAWQRSAVLRLPTSDGDLYFKAVPPIFAHEQRLNRYLETHFPSHSPQTVAFDEERNWFITRDFGGRLLLDVPDLNVWLDAYRRYAVLQIDLIEHSEDLRALGCPWRPLAERTDLIEPLLLDDDLLLLGREGGLTHEQAGTLRALGPRLRECWQALAASPIPASLDHGDLWPANIVVRGADVVFFDWSDCALTHPFLCFILSGPEAQAAFPQQPDVASLVRSAYLEPWRAHLPGVDVEAAFDLTWRIGALYYAMLYAHDILPHLSPRWELERMVPFYLRLVLERMEGWTAIIP